MDGVAADALHAFLIAVAQHYPHPARLLLLGGSALCLLGSSRPTLDIDYAGSDVAHDELQQAMEEVARDLRIVVEAVPIEQFVPISHDAETRHVHLGHYGQLEVFAFDPYTIALSKVDRGLDTDIDDVIFLVRRGYVELEQLTAMVREALTEAAEFDLDPVAMRSHLDVVHKRLTATS